MGCGCSDTKDEKPNDITNFFDSKEDQIAIQRVTQKQNQIIDDFNKKQGNSNNVGLSNITSCYIKFKNSTKGTTYTTESNAENILKFLENINPFNEDIKNNKEINNLQTELYDAEAYYSKIMKPKSKNVQVKSTQKIHNNYNLSLKLKNIKTNQSKSFDFNNLDRPLLIIFFDILSEKALNKIKEFKMKEIELFNMHDKNFILLPIINIFVDQYENVCHSKKYKQIIDIINENHTDGAEANDYFVLIKNINDHFTQLFELDKMKQSKCVIINRNSEISLILDEKIEYLNFDIVDFFLNTRNSEYSEDYFSFENKQHIIDILEKDCKDISKKFQKKFLFEVDLKVISSEKKLPVYLRFTYHEKDKDLAEKLYKQVASDIRSKVKKAFCVDYMVKSNTGGLFDMVKYLKNKLDEGLFIYKKKENNNNSYSYVLNCKSVIINDNNINCNSTNNNDICKNKKYMLNYYIDQPIYISEILNTYSLIMDKTPKYANLNCKYQIFPLRGTKLKSVIPKCKEIKKEILKSKINNNIEESDFDLQKNQTEVILLIHHNILSSPKERNKIYIVLEALYNNEIKFAIFLFGENDSDINKLNLLKWDKFNSNDGDDKFKIIFLNKIMIENYYPFCFYSRENFFKILRLNKDFNLTEMYNLDLYDPNQFSLSSIKNRNIFNFLIYISKKENIDINDNNIPFNDDGDITRFKQNKKKIYDLISGVDIFNNNNSNKLLTEININLTYNKLYVFPQNGNANQMSKKYGNANMSLIYLDCINENNFDVMKKVISDNNTSSSGKSSSIYIKLKEQKIETINLLENKQKNFKCQKCNKSYTLDLTSFYFCYKCQPHAFFCDDCYRKYHESIKGKKKKKEKNEQSEQIQENNIFHEHHLLLFYNYTQKKTAFIIKDELNKYMNIIENSRLKKTCKVVCSFCHINKHLLNSNVIISHLKKNKIQNMGIDNNDNDYEFIICDKCFKSNNFINVLLEEKSGNNFIIL